MIDYETYSKIKQYHLQRGLTVPQIANALGLSDKTVSKWLAEPKFRTRQQQLRPSKLDPYKSLIIQWLETHDYSGTQIFQKLKEIGYEGGPTIVRDYVSRIRPKRAPAYLTLAFEPGECAQVDWGEFGSIAIGQTRRRLSFFVMVLCYSRLMYVEFTVSQTMEHFLGCHQNAFQAFGCIPKKLMVDNLRSAVLKRITGELPVLNPRYRDFADYHGFEVVPCGVGKGNEKGRVENAVGYVKSNFLRGLDIPPFAAINPAVRTWLDSIANVRVHGTTRERPIDRFNKERPYLQSLPPVPFDVGTTHSVRANSRFRVTLDTNRYSVPAEYASQPLTLKAYPDRLFVFHQDKLICQHARCYDRHQDFELADHPKPLLAQRRHAREQQIYAKFIAISPKAEAYHQGLIERRLNARDHVRRIVALSEIYGQDKVARVLDDCLTLQAFNAEYITNLLEQREKQIPEPSALHLTRSQDLLELDLPDPDLSRYEPDQPAHPNTNIKENDDES
jgi:transposase|tara:strand:- start:980 stop:2488 length:1509 start_codon:yes stop_codon:yes gene_type:complete